MSDQLASIGPVDDTTQLIHEMPTVAFREIVRTVERNIDPLRRFADVLCCCGKSVEPACCQKWNAPQNIIRPSPFNSTVDQKSPRITLQLRSCSQRVAVSSMRIPSAEMVILQRANLQSRNQNTGTTRFKLRSLTDKSAYPATGNSLY